MSNNNPHSHINQTAQNSSWNPLQIPSYIPRQPQLAHMSNERPMVRSPLAWHAAAPPPESLYNFMSAANHKNLEHSMNPLLPPYVRGPPPFDSMDLSLQSNRSSSSPLNKNAHSLLQPPPTSTQLDYGHKQAQQHQHSLHQQQLQQQMHAQNTYPIHNLSTSSTQAQQHATATGVGMQNVSSAPSTATTQSPPVQNTGKFLSSNGNDCEQQPTSLIQTSQASAISSNNGSSSYQRHSAENYAKMTHMNRNFENDPHSKSLQKPVELVNKDCSYTTMMPNKLPTTHLQQQSSKKHSPLQGTGGATYHIPQSPFNTPAPTGKHNGPHTPPTPQSPSMHQAQQPTPQQLQAHQALLHGASANAGVLDYNQLHLQQPHNPYTQQHLQQQQQHLHHAFSQSQHHQHAWQHQQSQAQQQPPPQVPNSVLLTSQHQHQQQPLQSLIQTTAQMHSPQRQQKPSHSTMLSKLEAKSPATTPTYAVNVETNLEQRNIERQTNIVPPPPAPPPTPPRRDLIPDTADSPDTNASSNDDDSSDGKPLLRTHHQKKSSPQQSQDYKSPNSPRSVGKDVLCSSTSTFIGTAKASSKSPKSSPSVKQHKSPQKPDIGSPEFLDLSSQRSIMPKNIQSPATNTRSPSLVPQQHDDSETDSVLMERRPLDIVKNGCTPPTAADGDVETIDKIAEMIAKTASNSSHSSNSNDVHSISSGKSTRTDICESPKTKKQRQALKLRNAEHNTDWSANSNHDSNASLPQAPPPTEMITTIPLATNDDNAVLAEELRKESTPPPLHSSPKRKQPMSPHSNSRSSSSSSSSSSCSNSTHSSCASKSQKPKSAINDNTASETNSSKLKLTGKENVCDVDVVAKMKLDDNQTADNIPLNLNCKTPTGTSNVAATPASPDKSSFEEVENKLEEMFAGIEDEPPPVDKSNAVAELDKTLAAANKADEARVATNLSAALELSNSFKSQTVGVVASPLALPAHPTPVQTKAAKKSTVPSPVKPDSPSLIPVVLNMQVPQELAESKKAASKISTPAEAPTRKPLPRRRLSVALDPSNLRIMLDDQENVCATTSTNNGLENPNEISRELILQLGGTTDNAGEDINKANTTDKCRTNKGSKNTTTTVNTSKMRSTGSSGSSTSAAKTTSKQATGKKNKSNQLKQMQQKRRRQSSSDEDISNTLTREPTSSSSNSNNSNEKFKSPFVLVKRDGSVSIVNAATAEDNGIDKQAKTKKLPASYAKQERRNIRGFHSSTLSQKYDADTTDSTWICVFCKRGPHRMGLGDLFGPYLVTIDCEEYRNAFNASDSIDVDEQFVSKRRRVDMVQCNARGPPVVPATKTQEALAATNRTHKKKKKSIDEKHPPTLQTTTSFDPLDTSIETFLGMNKVSENSYEVWLHEDCTVWAPGVFLVGARIMGLDSAVWNSTRYNCVLCAKTGATVCCLERECKAAAHVPCARDAIWRLNESNWHVYCQAHIIKPTSSSAGNTPTITAAVNPPNTGAIKYVKENPSTSIS